jgi:DNA processing protein
MDDKQFWVAFSLIEAIGPQKYKKLYQYFPDMRTAWQADLNDFIQAGLSSNDATTIINKRHDINPASEWERLNTLHIKVTTIADADYPKMLKEIYSPPAILYVKGTVPTNLDFTVAVVGTRAITNYGRQITPEIVKILVEAGIVIVSGLALGVDALAHQSCLEAGGQTIAVLGCGLDNIYPVTNRQLAEKITTGGAIISEYPLGAQPLKQHFPARNRIISGLSRGVLVIEGSQDSGSLITAKCGLEQNREIMAVPGNINSQTSVGPNQLIKMGAKVVTSAVDVLETLDLNFVKQFVENKKILPASREEELLLRYLSTEPRHIDEIIENSKLNTSTANAALIMMEMKGLVRHLGGGNYVLSR